MGTPNDHPYSIDIRPVHDMPGHFTYSIYQMRVPRRRSRKIYPSFDEARLAARQTLNRFVLEHWLVEEPRA